MPKITVNGGASSEYDDEPAFVDPELEPDDVDGEHEEGPEEKAKPKPGPAKKATSAKR